MTLSSFFGCNDVQTNEACITRIVANFWHFIMHKVHKNDRYFCNISELVTEDKFRNLRAWESLRIKDYKMPYMV